MNERIFSAPGRVEIGGNHTDHQHGRVLAAAINLDVWAVVSPGQKNIIRVTSDGGSAEVDINDLEPRADETGTTAALVRGVTAWFSEHGYPVGGFDAKFKSDIPPGSGLSSSAAVEIVIGNILKGLFGAELSAVDIAIAGQFAENVYFGKPSGLMDQAASSVGGLVAIDFLDPAKPVVTPVNANFEGYVLCVVSTGASHANLTREYAAITEEMKSVANFFEKDFLRDVPPEKFFASVKELRGQAGDRAVLRALHFFEENERVAKQTAALSKGDMPAFLKLVGESGRSSLGCLQNYFCAENPREQSLTLAFALSERVLGSRGACRVHGGGFGGSVLAFVPKALKKQYRAELEAVFGAGACHFLTVRENGGMEVR